MSGYGFKAIKYYTKRWLCTNWLWASPLCHYYWLTRCVQWCLQTSCNPARFWRCFGEFVVSITVCWVWGQTGREKHSEHSGYIVVVTSPLSSVCQGCVKSCRSVRVWCALCDLGNVAPSCGCADVIICALVHVFAMKQNIFCSSDLLLCYYCSSLFSFSKKKKYLSAHNSNFTFQYNGFFLGPCCTLPVSSMRISPMLLFFLY